MTNSRTYLRQDSGRHDGALLRHYRAYGRVIASASTLKGLEAAESGARPEIRVELAPAGDLPAATPDRWPHAFVISNQAWLRYGCEDDVHRLLFPDHAWFELLDGGRLIRAHPGPDLEDSGLQHLLLDHVLPLALSLQLQPVLHASAVVTPWGAVGFVGRSGRGKSTTATYLARTGWPLLCDDALALQRAPDFEAVPSYPAVRLWADSAEPLLGDVLSEASEREGAPKKRLCLHPYVPTQCTPARLVALFMLERSAAMPHDEVAQVESLSAVEAAVLLLQHAYRLHLPNRAAADFDWQSALATSVAIRRLRVRDNLQALPLLRAFLERWLGANLG